MGLPGVVKKDIALYKIQSKSRMDDQEAAGNITNKLV